MPAKLCKRHRCCKWPRKLKTPDTGRYRERRPRGGDIHTSPDVRAAAHCMRSSSWRSQMWCDKGKAAWWQIVPFKLRGESKKAESTTTVTLPRLASDTLVYPQRDEISAASRHAQRRNISTGQKTWGMSHSVASSATGNKLLTRSSGKPRGGIIHKKKHLFRYSVAKWQKAVDADTREESV